MRLLIINNLPKRYMRTMKKTNFEKVMNKYYKNLNTRMILDTIFQGTQYSSRYVHEFVKDLKKIKEKEKSK